MLRFDLSLKIRENNENRKKLFYINMTSWVQHIPAKYIFHMLQN